MDILFKPRIEATEQMAQNCMDISLSKNQRKRKSMYVEVFFLFQLYFTRTETQVEGTYLFNYSIISFK